MRRHPSKSKLVHWLESGETGKVGDHVEQCERCADQLLVLDRDESTAEANPERRARRERLAEMLSALYTAPDDLNERVVDGVERRSKGERELALFAGLMAVGVDTARLVASASLAGSSEHAELHDSRYGQNQDSVIDSTDSDHGGQGEQGSSRESMD